MENLLEVSNLTLTFKTKKGSVDLINDINFHVKKSEILGIVGESGCGKSITSLSLMNLLPENGKIRKGSIKLLGKELTDLTEAQWCNVRGNDIAMIFQDPLSSLNPVMKIGTQMMEPIIRHQGLNKEEARKKALEMLKAVGISSPERRMNEYPHQLSGGMRQRVMIGMALACRPQLLIADEPTTALDVTIQSQILDLMKELREASGTAIMLVTHDMGVVAETADRVIVMYAGKIVEEAEVKDLFENPLHPYTQGLLQSIPRIDIDCEELYTIKGTVPDLSEKTTGCLFCERCPYAREICKKQEPKLYKGHNNSYVKCWRYEEQGSHE